MIVTLPWPDKRLSPNSRTHWRQLSEVKTKARWDAAILTLEAMNGQARVFREGLPEEGQIGLKVTFYPPDARHRDDDNMIGSFKAARDGIADALDINDRRFRPEYRFGDPQKPGRIEVVLHNLLTIDQAVLSAGLCPVNGDRPFSGGDQ